MKALKFFSILSLVLFSITAIAKNVTSEIKVYGNCDMCKEKIETAMDRPGISFSEWNEDTKILTVRYNDEKITEDEIHQIISDLGYSTDKLEANKEAQNKLDKCCQPKEVKKGCCSGSAACGSKS